MFGYIPYISQLDGLLTGMIHFFLTTIAIVGLGDIVFY
jgi:hypothetical protein